MLLDASIIITTYNVERYIERAVHSALAQQGVNVEIVIVDDCSSDSTWQQVSAMDDPRIRPFRLETNSGPGAARNKGFAEARGEWIVVLDGDDAMEPERIERCVALARAMQADIVVDNITVCREEDGKEFPMYPLELFARLERIELPVFIRDTLVGSDYPLGYLKPIFSAAFLRQHGLQYTTQLRIGEDYLIMVEALALKALCVVEPQAGYRYTVRAGSISHRLTLAHIEQMQTMHAAFAKRFTFDEAARKALHQRGRLLYEMRAYAQLVAAIKARSAKGAAYAVASSPKALLQLWEPVFKRLTRVIN